MMKRWLVFVLAGLILSLSAGFCLAQDDVAKQASCKYCGMDRKTFAHSRMLVTYEDGSSMGTCSLHCTAVELALNIDKTPKSIEVGDFKTKKLIDAEKAFWVIGGSKPGVMTKRAKWAFESKADADAFIKENGGKPASFDEAIKASYEDMYADTKMIRDKRKMMKKMKAPAEHKH
jgi:nitrous oxide reductase accessory protein NosL